MFSAGHISNIFSLLRIETTNIVNKDKSTQLIDSSDSAYDSSDSSYDTSEIDSDFFETDEDCDEYKRQIGKYD